MPGEDAPEKEMAATGKRSSVTSHEDSGRSPSSTHGSDNDTISEASSPIEGDYDRRGKALRPTISHASSATGAVGGIPPHILDRAQTRRSTATNATSDLAFEVDFEDEDDGNPQTWPMWFKAVILAVMSFATTSVVLYSTSYTSAIPGMEDEFGISNDIANLGITTYLLGMAVGAVILAPLSEMFGRRPVYIVALGLFVILTIPCALAPNIIAILVTRFFGAFCAAAMISNAPGTVNDIIDEEYRALAFSIWSIGPMNGPVIGPVVGGFTFQGLGWRWTNWVVTCVSGAAFVAVACIRETYAPSILRKRAEKKRKETGDARWWSRYDAKTEFLPLLKVNLSRPFVMTVTEPILIFWDLYIAIVYGILYLCFVAYPIVFNGLRGWAPGIGGLAFCGIGVGSLIVIVCEPLIRKMINAHKKDEDGNVPPEAMVSAVCIAAICIPAGQIWFSWTCTPNVHWIWPILAGIPFGAGNAAVFIYATNYLVHSYGVYAASALAGNAVLRSIMGATLPLAGPAMYAALGPNWAGTLLGLVEAVCIPIPFIFYRYGHKIRQKSALIRSMQEDKRKMDTKKRVAAEKEERRLELEAEGGAGMLTGSALEEMEDAEQDVEKGHLHRYHQHDLHQSKEAGG